MQHKLKISVISKFIMICEYDPYTLICSIQVVLITDYAKTDRVLLPSEFLGYRWEVKHREN